MIQRTTTVLQVRHLTQCVLVVLLIATLVYGEQQPRQSSSRLAFLSSVQHSNASTLSTSSTRNNDESTTTTTTKEPRDARREIKVQKSLSVPFNAQIAFDNFANLPRQAEYSPWLKRVVYVTPPPTEDTDWGGETKWSMGLFGLSFSWNSICTTVDRPHVIEWKSITGLVNFGRVEFEEEEESSTTNVTLTMTFVAPRVICSIFRRSSKLANFVQNRMLATTLHNFSDIVAAEQQAELENDGTTATTTNNNVMQ